jgi:mannose-6-phosphate isomerase-like protein (cupin superfamily)
MTDYSIVRADEAEDAYAGTDVPGGEEVEQVPSGSVVRVAPNTTRSHRNEGDEPVEMWAVSRRIEEQEATKVEDFWEPSDRAARD